MAEAGREEPEGRGEQRQDLEPAGGLAQQIVG
jgi:hypothetical protein